MRKYISIIFALALIFTVALVGCEKKAEAPKPAVQKPTVVPAPPAPAPVPAAAPTPAPEPEKPAKK